MDTNRTGEDIFILTSCNTRGGKPLPWEMHEYNSPQKLTGREHERYKWHIGILQHISTKYFCPAIPLSIVKKT